MNDGLQNKGAGEGNHGPNRGFLPVEFDPWLKPGWVALLTTVLNSAWCKFNITVQGFILTWKPVFTLPVEGKALRAREYIQFVLLGGIWRIYAWSLPQYIFVVILYICCIEGVTLLDVEISFLLTFSFELRSCFYDQIASAS